MFADLDETLRQMLTRLVPLDPSEVGRARPIDLGYRLFDTALLRLPSRWVWYLSIHHLIADGPFDGRRYRYCL